MTTLILPAALFLHVLLHLPALLPPLCPSSLPQPRPPPPSCSTTRQQLQTAMTSGQRHPRWPTCLPRMPAW